MKQDASAFTTSISNRLCNWTLTRGRLAHLQVAASRLQLQKQAAETQKAVRMWTDRAEAAVQADKDDLARYALRQRTNAQVAPPCLP